MKKIITTVALPLFSLMIFANVATAKDLVNVSGATGIAINGFDPVSFFTEKKPVNGDPGIKAKYKGATYLFSTKDNKSAFEKSPEQYAPQYGGYCAYGASVNALFPVDVSTWQVRNGKLYLNLNPSIVEAFNEDFDGAITKANKNWPKLEDGHGKKSGFKLF